jgi:hypothetical protein
MRRCNMFNLHFPDIACTGGLWWGWGVTKATLGEDVNANFLCPAYSFIPATSRTLKRALLHRSYLIHRSFSA